MPSESPRCQDWQQCEHDAEGCAGPATAEPLGTFHLFRHIDTTRAYSSSWWGWLKCRWHHGERWLFEDELPPYALTASLSDTDQYCPTCDLVR